MNRHNISLLAQQDGKSLTTDGIHAGGNNALCLDGARGLLALSTGEASTIALEVLQDDMSVNMDLALRQVTGSTSGVSLCLQESLDNINEYLRQKQADSNSALELGVIQLGNQQLSAYVCGSICAARYRAEQLEMLCDETRAQPLPGAQAHYSPRLIELDFQVDDLLLLTTARVFDTLGADFIRLTLVRFHDNLQMALRQINTRALHHGLPDKPLVILGRIEKVEKNGALNWFRRLRNG